MGKRVANPFPQSEWAQEAYAKAAYMSVTTGNEFDYETGELKTKPRFTNDRMVLSGNPGEVFTKLDALAELGIRSSQELINLIFIMGYMFAQLAETQEPTAIARETHG